MRHCVYLRVWGVFFFFLVSSVPRSDNSNSDLNLTKIRHFYFQSILFFSHCLAYRWRMDENEQYHWQIMGKWAFKVKNFLIKVVSLHSMQRLLCGSHWIKMWEWKDKIKHSGHLQRLWNLTEKVKKKQIHTFEWDFFWCSAIHSWGPNF